MARITVEDCLEKMNNRFELVLVAADRARQLLTGEAKTRLDWGKDKATVLALREIAGGLVEIDEFTNRVRSVHKEEKEEPLFPVSSKPSLGMMESLASAVESSTSAPKQEVERRPFESSSAPSGRTSSAMASMIPSVVLDKDRSTEDSKTLSANIIPPVMVSASQPANSASDEDKDAESDEGASS